MAYPGSWTTYRADPSMFFAVDPVNFILGAGSLRIHRNATTGRYAHAIRASSPLAFTSGRMRSLFKRVASTSGDVFGMLFQQSAADLTGGSGAAYAAVLDSIGGTTAILRLFKFTAGLATSSTIVNSGLTLTTSAAVALECTWVLDLAGTGGIRITVKYGVATDFSDLVTGIDTLVTSSVLATSLGEGPFIALTSTSSSGDYLFDEMDAYPIVVGG